MPLAFKHRNVFGRACAAVYNLVRRRNMKKALGILAVLSLLAAPAFGATITLTVTPSTDDAVVDYYLVEENGVELATHCPPGCTEYQLNDRANGTYVYRVGSFRTGAPAVGWSAPYTVVVDCAPPIPTPDAPEITAGSYVCD